MKRILLAVLWLMLLAAPARAQAPMPNSLFDCFAQMTWTTSQTGVRYPTFVPITCIQSVVGIVPTMDWTAVDNWQRMFPTSQPAAADQYLVSYWNGHCPNCAPKYDASYPYTYVYTPSTPIPATPTPTPWATPTPTPWTTATATPVVTPIPIPPWDTIISNWDFGNLSWQATGVVYPPPGSKATPAITGKITNVPGMVGNIPPGVINPTLLWYLAQEQGQWFPLYDAATGQPLPWAPWPGYGNVFGTVPDAMTNYLASLAPPGWTRPAATSTPWPTPAPWTPVPSGSATPPWTPTPTPTPVWTPPPSPTATPPWTPTPTPTPLPPTPTATPTATLTINPTPSPTPTPPAGCTAAWMSQQIQDKSAAGGGEVDFDGCGVVQGSVNATGTSYVVINLKGTRVIGDPVKKVAFDMTQTSADTLEYGFVNVVQAASGQVGVLLGADGRCQRGATDHNTLLGMNVDTSAGPNNAGIVLQLAEQTSLWNDWWVASQGPALVAVSDMGGAATKYHSPFTTTCATGQSNLQVDIRQSEFVNYTGAAAWELYGQMWDWSGSTVSFWTSATPTEPAIAFEGPYPSNSTKYSANFNMDMEIEGYKSNPVYSGWCLNCNFYANLGPVSH